jgi:hypothetical protein
VNGLFHACTPCPCKYQDLWNIGRFLGLEAFGPSADDDAANMTRELRAAQRRDRATRQGSDVDQDIVRGITKGAVPQLDSEFEDVMLKWINAIRENFAGAVVRRTIYSVDHNGDRISGLQPFQEHLLVLNLYPLEMQNLDSIAQEMMSDASQSVTKFTGSGVNPLHVSNDTLANLNTQHFYIQIRRALLHRSCNSNHQWGNPTTIAEWKKDPSRKLDALIELLQYHLAAGNRPHLHVHDDRLVPSAHAPMDTTASPDKIVVYVAFPSSNLQVLAVSLSRHTFTPITYMAGRF